MVDGEFRNIEKFEYEKTFVENILPDFIFPIYFVSEQLSFFVSWGNWSVLPDGTVAKKNGSSQSF